MPTLERTLTDAFLISALGDAWGYAHEFSNLEQILAAGTAVPDPLLISDDTQMAMATFAATSQLLENHPNIRQLLTTRSGEQIARTTYAEHYLQWKKDPHNNRSPGNTCMQSLAEIERGIRESNEPVQNNSLGCGTVMRTPVLAMFTDLEDSEIFNLGVLSSQVTHGHRLAHFTAGIAPILVRCYNDLGNDKQITGQTILDIAAQTATVFSCDDTEYQAYAEQLCDFAANWHNHAEVDDLCDLGGEGWTATECLLTALTGFALAADNTAQTPATSVFTRLRPLIETRGDTDSIACVGGWFIGAYFGLAEEETEYVLNHMETNYRRWFQQHCDC